METEAVLEKIRANRSALMERGVLSLSLFGSRARGDGNPDSDFDFAVRLDPRRVIGGFGFVNIVSELARIAGTSIDLVAEPARKPRVQAEIDRSRQRVF